MNREHFNQSLANDQFNEVVEKSLSANEHNAAHSHPFDVRALVTQGDITLTVDGVRRAIVKAKYLPWLRAAIMRKTSALLV